MNGYEWLDDEHGVEVNAIHACDKLPKVNEVIRDQNSEWHVIKDSNFQYSIKVIHCPYCGIKLEENKQ